MSDRILDAEQTSAAAEAEAKAPASPTAAPKAMSGLGVCSVICGMFGFLFPLPAFFGLGMAIYGLTRDRRDILCYVGLCLSAAMLAFNLVSLVQLCGSSGMDALMGNAPSPGDVI